MRHGRPGSRVLAEDMLYIRRWAAVRGAMPSGRCVECIVVDLSVPASSASQRPSAQASPQLPRRPPICAIKSQSGPPPNSRYLALQLAWVGHGPQFTLCPERLLVQHTTYSHCNLHLAPAPAQPHDRIDRRRACSSDEDKTGDGRRDTSSNSWLRRLSQQVPRSHRGACNRRSQHAATSVHQQALAPHPLQALQQHRRTRFDSHQHTHQSTRQSQAQHGASKARADAEGECAEGAPRPRSPRERELGANESCRAGTSLQRTAAARRTR
jgi:hypothetical protein